MRIVNTSKLFTTQQIKEIVQFVRPPNISNFVIKVKNSRPNSYAGTAYTQGCCYGDSNGKQLVTIRIGKLKFPYKERNKRAGYLKTTFFTNEDVLVHLIAHELRHLWQAKVKRGWRVWGARGKFSERDADAYAISKMRHWRRK